MTGYGYTGMLVAFIARGNPLAVIPVALLLGGIGASGGLLQRVFDLPDATVNVLQGILFISILFSRDVLRPQPDELRLAARAGGAARADRQPAEPAPRRRWRRDVSDAAVSTGAAGVPLAVLGGAIRISTPFLFVSLGECLTEKSGRVNLGLEGTLVMGAMGALRHLVPDRLALAGRAGRRRARRACWARCTPGCAAARASTTSPSASR